MTSLQAELFTDTRLPLANLSAKPKTSNLTGAGRYQLLSCYGCLPQAAWSERLSPKSQDAVALQQIKERGALPAIDRGDIRQAIDRCSNIWPTAGRWLYQIRAQGRTA